MTACNPNPNGGKHCLRDSDFELLNDRFDAADERVGELMAELSAANGHAAAAYKIGQSTLNAVLELRADMGKENERRIKEEGIQNDRIRRLENHDDTLLASSAVSYSHEALARKYEERKAELVEMIDRMKGLETRLTAESKAKREALEAEHVAKAKARTALWGAVGVIVMAVASAVVAALKAGGM